MKWVVIVLVAVIATAVGAWWYDDYRAQSALLEQPVYRVLKQHERLVYDGLLDEYRVYQRGEEGPEKFTNLANSQISEAATQRLAHASNESVYALIQDMVLTAKKLEGKPEDACFHYWFPQVAGPPDVARYIEPAAQAHTLDLMGNVIRSAAEHPVALPEPDAVKDNLAKIIDATYAQYGSDAQMLANAADPRVDRAKVCVITISLYERILQLPPADASALLRAMTQLR